MDYRGLSIFGRRYVALVVSAGTAAVSLADTFVFASVLLFGPAAGTATIALAGLASSAWQRRDRPPPHRVLFGAAAPALALWVTAHLFYPLPRVPPLSGGSASTPPPFLPHMVFA